MTPEELRAKAIEEVGSYPASYFNAHGIRLIVEGTNRFKVDNETEKAYKVAVSLAERTLTAEELLQQVREACLFIEDDGEIGVTTEPHISEELFKAMCECLPKRENRPLKSR